MHISGCVEGTPIWIEKRGEGHPAVILINGSGDSINQAWGTVLPDLAKITQVFAYDRPGLGNSAPPPNLYKPNTAKLIVLQLRKLLKQAGINPPYILVAHSIGGLYLQYFARNYPHEVAGIVMVDGNIVPGVLLNQIHGLSPALSAKIPELIREDQQDELKNQAQLKYLLQNLPSTPSKKQYSAIENNLENLGKKESAAEVENSPPLPHVPMVVLVSRQDPIWHTIQKQFADQIPGTLYQVYPKSGHYIQRYYPQAVVAAVQFIFDKVLRPKAQHKFKRYLI